MYTIHLSIYPSNYPSNDLFTHLPIYPSIHLPVYPSIHLPIYSSLHLPIYPSLHLPIYPSIHLSMSVYICLHHIRSHFIWLNTVVHFASTNHIVAMAVKNLAVLALSAAVLGNTILYTTTTSQRGWCIEPSVSILAHLQSQR